MSDKMEAFWKMVNAHLEIGVLGNLRSSIDIGPDHTIVVTGGHECDSTPNQENLSSLEEFSRLQVTLHGPDGLTVPPADVPGMESFSEMIWERYPATYIGSNIHPSDIADMLLHAGILKFTRTLH